MKKNVTINEICKMDEVTRHLLNYDLDKALVFKMFLCYRKLSKLYMNRGGDDSQKRKFIISGILKEFSKILEKLFEDNFKFSEERVLDFSLLMDDCRENGIRIPVEMFRIITLLKNSLIQMKIRKAVCLLYFDTTGEVLAVKRLKTNNYGLPGGKVDKDETPEEAIVREIKEETNLDLDKKQLIPIYAAFVNGFYCTTYMTLQTYLNLDNLKQMENHIKPVFVNSKTLICDSEFKDYNVGVFDSYKRYNLLSKEK